MGRVLLRLLFVGVALVVVLVGAAVAWFGLTYLSRDVDTVGSTAFTRPLAVPPLAESRVDAQGRRVFDLTMQEGRTDLGREDTTPTWGFNGSYLGPTLRATRGEQVAVDVTNTLAEASTVHWHGMHLPAAMDGGPHQPIEPGATWSPTWEVDQPSATLWYHPHPHGETAEHVYRGLAGMFIVDDPADRDAHQQLPHTYGVDDVPVIVQDKRFDGSELDDSAPMFAGTGVIGDTLLVNGTPGPYLEVTTERVRLRLLNASNARSYLFGFDDRRSMAVVASDGGLLPAPVDLTELWLSPGERAEVVVEVAPGEEAVLRSERTGQRGGGRLEGGDDRFDVLELRAADALEPSPEVPDTLAEPPDLDGSAVAGTHRLRLSGTDINGRDMDMSRIDLVARAGTTERWTVANADGGPHNFHVHGVSLVVEEVDGRPPPPELAGWKDTVFIPAGSQVRLLVRYGDHTDADSPYMFHCHLLRHEDRGMMGQFVVLGPGEEAGSPGDAGHEH